MHTSESLLLRDGSNAHVFAKYKQVLGSFQFISLTRLVVTFAVNKLSKFICQPSTPHCSVVKRVLHNLKGTPWFIPISWSIFSSSCFLRC